MRPLFRAYLILIPLAAAWVSCSPGGSPPGQEHPSTRYASRFSIENYDSIRVLKVRDPWQNSRGISYSYVLYREGTVIPDSLSAFPRFQVPVKRVVTLSTTHLAMIDHLGAGDCIVGASGTQYVCDRRLRQRIDSGLIREVGYDRSLRYETLVSLEPDVVFLYGVEGSIAAVAGKLEELGISTVLCAEYLEAHPLGKTEWLRFFAAFLDRGREAERLFSRVDSAYTALASSARGRGSGPRILSGLPWKDTWYVPGGESFAARLIRDAGGTYLWSADSSTEALPLDLESVYARAVQADIWINPGSAVSLDDIRSIDDRFADLPVMETGQVVNNNARMGPGGGNDYWESGTVRPDRVLADLIHVFHPDLLPDHSLFYYQKLK